ncbi:Transcription elongation regulator 1-like protein [Coemansia sp. RSA 2399]|nr:Transcription elongation regulator 1-like protein [Coemansia sp. RSA 2399]
MDRDAFLKLQLEELNVPEKFRNTGREWAAFEAPANPSKELQCMPRELYFYERTLGISTWFQPIDYVLPQRIEDLYTLGKQWQDEVEQKRSRERAKQDRPVKQSSMGTTAWVRVETQQGRTYYYNKKTQESTWVKPIEQEEAKEEDKQEAGTEYDIEDAEWMMAQMNGTKEEDPDEEDVDEPTEEPESQQLTKDERLMAFRKMLFDGSVDPFGSWEMQSRKFQHDERFAWISDDAERCDLFNAVCAQIIEEKQKQHTESKTQGSAQDPFDEMLHECVSKRMSFARFCEKNLSDPRYLTIKTSREREKRFTQFMDREFPNK